MLNSELWNFLNNPNYRRSFREAGKLNLLSKYKKAGYPLEDYGWVQWSDLQGEK